MWYKNRVEVPGEIIFEVITAEDGAGFGFAVAEIKRSQRHRHLKTVETYVLLKGVLGVYLNDQPFLLIKTGNSLVIPPGTRHWAKSLSRTPAKIAVITIPAWSQEDHILDE